MVIASRRHCWALDEQGNWSTFTTNGTPQSRTHNYQNQATVVGGNNLTFDNNGNTKVDENGRQYIYDAWDRVVEMKTSGGVRIARFSFDALGRRITETDNGPAKDFYYSDKWQLLEERHTGAVKSQYIWSPVYVDALIVRDRNNDANPDLEERLYVQQDANWNVTALVNPGGQVKERYLYDPYGQPTAIKADWTSYSSGQEAGLYDWLYLHQGGRFFRFDSSAGIYHFRRRELSATLGRWMQVDPIRFAAGDDNLYRYGSNNAPNTVDPNGLQQGNWPAKWYSVNRPLYPPQPKEPPPDPGPIPGPEKGSYYPPQCRNLKTNKVAIITDDTCRDDKFSWIPVGQQYSSVGGYDDLQGILNRYGDGSIDVLMFSGHQGGQCNCRTMKGEYLGGWNMPPDIYALIGQKLSKDGEVIIACCYGGGTPSNVQLTANAMGAPVTATPGWTRGDGPDFPGGCSASEPWITLPPKPFVGPPLPPGFGTKK